MEKEIVSLMCQNIRSQFIDIDEMVQNDPERTIEYIHGQYKLAAIMFDQKKFQCVSTA